MAKLGRKCLGTMRNVAIALPIAAAIGGAPDEAKAAGVADALRQAEGSALRPYTAWRGHQRASPPQGQGDAGAGLNDTPPATYHRGDIVPPDLWESLVGACTGGMFSGAVVTEVLSMIAIASGGAAVPLAAGAVASAAAVGCGGRMVSAFASNGSKAVWREVMR